MLPACASCSLPTVVFRSAGSSSSAAPHEVDDGNPDKNDYDDADDSESSDSRYHGPFDARKSMGLWDQLSCTQSLVRQGPV